MTFGFLGTFYMGYSAPNNLTHPWLPGPVPGGGIDGKHEATKPPQKAATPTACSNQGKSRELPALD